MSKTCTGGNDHDTIAPVTASPANDAEFMDAAGLRICFGIKRSLAYLLMAEGLIRGVSLRRRGQTRGKRLFEVASVRAYLKSQMESNHGQ